MYCKCIPSASEAPDFASASEASNDGLYCLIISHICIVSFIIRMKSLRFGFTIDPEITFLRLFLATK